MMKMKISKNAIIPLLVAGMLITGCSNSLFSKWQDMQCVENCDDPDESNHVEFSQPVWQTAQMFFGECLCLLPVLIRIIYQTYFKRDSTSTSNSKRKRRDQLNDLDSEPLLNNQNHQDSSTKTTTTTRREETNESILAGPSKSTGESLSSPTLSKPNHKSNHSQSETERGRGSERPRGRSRTKSSSKVKQTKNLTGKAIFLFFTPAICDICGTTLMNVGLLFTPVSIYQMTRGALVLWVGVFSVIFLRRHLFLFQWLSLVSVMFGVCIVGLSGTILKSSDPDTKSSIASTTIITLRNKLTSRTVSVSSSSTSFFKEKEPIEEPELPEAAQALLGVLLILFAQLFTASQFVLEEKIMSRYNVEPLLAVGYEGLFGLTSVLFLMPIFHWWIGMTPNGKGGYFDMITGWNQMIHHSGVLWSSVAIALSIALFNFFGLSVTRSVSATARSTIDTCRTLGIWIVSLYLGWEVFLPLSGSLQILGFLFLVLGTFVFNGIIIPPKFLRPSASALAEAASNESRSKSKSRSKSRSRQHQSSRRKSSKHHKNLDVNGNGYANSTGNNPRVEINNGDGNGVGGEERERLLERRSHDLENSVETLNSSLVSESENEDDQLKNSHQGER